MSLKGKWRIVEMEAWDKDFLDLVEPAYILFGDTESEFAFGCVTGSFGSVGDSHSIAFDWGGADEMDEAHGDGWVELQADGSLTGEITFHNGDEIRVHRTPLGEFFNSLLVRVPPHRSQAGAASRGRLISPTAKTS